MCPKPSSKSLSSKANSQLIRNAFSDPPQIPKRFDVHHNKNLFINIGKHQPYVIHAQEWISKQAQGSSGAMPPLSRALTVHGWLDNSNSFAKLAPLLAERYPLHIVAYDDAGCGHSHWKPYSNYSVLDSAVDILKIIHALEWNEDDDPQKLPHLIGHSRGAITAMFFAASFGEMVSSLTLLDAFGIASREAATSAQTLRVATLKSDKYDNTHSTRIFKDVEEAAQFIKDRYGYGMTIESARILASGQLLKREGGVSFSYDRNTIRPSSSSFTESQALSFVASITCPVLLLTPKTHSILENAKGKVYQRFKILNERKNVETRFRVCDSQGHHFHLNEPEPLVGHIVDFLDSQNDPAKHPKEMKARL